MPEAEWKGAERVCAFLEDVAGATEPNQDLHVTLSLTSRIIRKLVQSFHSPMEQGDELVSRISSSMLQKAE